MNTTARGWARMGLSLVAAGVAALMVASPAFAAKGGEPGAPSGETLGNNLSIPAIFVGDMTAAPALRIPCAEAAAAVAPTGPQSTVYPGYYLQKTEAIWSATCSTATGDVHVLADWGDNLTNDEVGVKAGKTIRVEMALMDNSGTSTTGYSVVKLEPEMLDRLSPYGTLGNPEAMTARAWDSGARLEIKTADGVTIYEAAATAEINSTGGVVYGYNWGQKGAFPPPGDYVITFTVSGGTTFDGTIDTTDRADASGQTATLAVTLLPKSGGAGNSGNSGNHGNPNK
ncbi:hypothetical protein P0L94_02360 [Microbacter sp. GSS18]|nr:hypothetical protein P0L94_02360 [Microbacter sp. GSS18]